VADAVGGAPEAISNGMVRIVHRFRRLLWSPSLLALVTAVEPTLSAFGYKLLSAEDGGTLVSARWLSRSTVIETYFEINQDIGGIRVARADSAQDALHKDYESFTGQDEMLLSRGVDDFHKQHVGVDADPRHLFEAMRNDILLLATHAGESLAGTDLP
jgi:hypothetical protein